MPAVYLSDDARRQAREEKDFARFAELVRTGKGRLRRKDYEIAEDVGITARAFCRFKLPENIGGMSLRRARRIAHAVGCTPEDWLRIGGFAKGGSKDAVDS